jgi:hypothetical protein
MFARYTISLKTADGQRAEVRRRYNEFVLVDNILEKRIPGAILPLLPEGGLSRMLAASASEKAFLESRAKVKNVMNVGCKRD